MCKIIFILIVLISDAESVYDIKERIAATARLLSFADNAQQAVHGL